MGPITTFGSSALLVHGPKGAKSSSRGQNPASVYGFDPDAKGKSSGKTRVGTGGSTEAWQWGMASDGQKVYASVPTFRVMIPRGLLVEPRFDPVKGGGLTALHLEDGGKAWFAPRHPCDRATPVAAHPVASAHADPGVVFSGSLDGHIRAFATGRRRVLWDSTPAKDYATVNGIPGQGRLTRRSRPGRCGGMIFVILDIARQWAGMGPGQRLAGVRAGRLKKFSGRPSLLTHSKGGPRLIRGH